jgi:F-type H+-transporting ATPase subunit epsilon
MSHTDVPGTNQLLRCILVTPEETAIDAPASFVAVPLYDGELGVAPRHSPMIGRLGYGELRLVEGNRTRRYYIDGGFVQVADDVVTILTGSAVPVERLDAEMAAEQLAAARARKPTTPESFAIRDRLVAQARAQLRLAGRTSGAPAHGH